MRHKVHAALSRHIQHPIVLEKPKDKKFGHYATPVAFSLAKKLRKSPMLIAEELAALLRREAIFEAVEPLKGYVNLKLSPDFLNTYTSWALQNPDQFGRGENRGNFLLEFVSANPTGPLHIGHARGAVVGDVLARVGAHLGYRVHKEYYVNDAGNQIDLLGLSLYLSAREQLGLAVTWPEEFYRGEYIHEMAARAIERFGRAFFEEEANRQDLAQWGKDRMLEKIRATLDDVDISFDSFVSEKELYAQWETVFEQLRGHDALYEEGGKWWLKSTAFGDEKDRVVVREDGRPTYLAGDVIYHWKKFERGFAHYINIWGADHHGYIARVKAAVRFLGHDDAKLEIILSQMVSLLKGGEPYKMSKRAGNFILMQDVLDEIGADALRLVFLTKKSDTHLEFDVEDLKKEDSSNPVFYINYAHARVYSLFEKAGKTVEDVIDADFGTLVPEAHDLLFAALLLPEVLEDAFSARQVQKLSEYLKHLAGMYHKFYYDHKVIGTPQENSLLKLSAMVALSIGRGLKLLGIDAKQRM